MWKRAVLAVDSTVGRAEVVSGWCVDRVELRSYRGKAWAS